MGSPNAAMPTDLNLIPAGTPPPGVNSYPLFKGESLATTTLVLFCILVPIATLAVILRLLASHKVRGNGIRGIGWADVCSVGALIFAIGQESIILSLHKTQRHGWDISVATLTTSYFKRVFAQNLLAWPTIILSKLAILLLYLRIFTVQRGMRFAIYAGIFWIFLTYIPNMVVACYLCAAHPGEPWSFAVGRRCSEPGPTKWLITSATMSVLLDLYILLLPVPVVRRLNMSVRRRVGVLLIFFTAFFACVCAILTLVYRIKLVTTDDDEWLSAELFICNLVENFIAIIVGAIPGCSSCLKSFSDSPLFSGLYSKLPSSFTRSSRTPGSSKGTHRLHNRSRENTESQKSLHQAVGLHNIKVERDYKIDSQPGEAPYRADAFQFTLNAQSRF